jgi:hypothetical protein
MSESSVFTTAFDAWFAAASKIHAAGYVNSPENCRYHLEAPPAKGRYRRILSMAPGAKSGVAWAFIDTTNGDVLKPAGYKGPAKHARGNIFDEFGGLRYLEWTGPYYLK